MLRRNPNNSFRLAVGALIVCSALAAHAEKADRSKPINIEADQASLDQQKGVTVYEGNVILTQGTSKLTAAKLTVNQDKAGNQYGTAIGNPATFRQRLDPDSDGKVEWINGKGQRIDYDNAKQLVTIYDNGRVQRGGDVVTGNVIIYDGKTQQFQATGTRSDAHGQAMKGGKGRVTVVIQPREKKEGANK